MGIKKKTNQILQLFIFELNLYKEVFLTTSLIFYFKGQHGNQHYLHFLLSYAFSLLVLFYNFYATNLLVFHYLFLFPLTLLIQINNNYFLVL